MENLVTSTMKIRTPSGEHIHHHPYAVGRINPASVTPSATLHPSQQIVASNTGDYNNDIEFYSGPSSHDVINWKNVGVSNNVGVLANPVHHSYGLPVNVNNVGRDPNSMDALAIRISTGNGSLGSRSDGTDLVIDDLISNPDEDEAMVPPMRSGGSRHQMTRDRSLSGDQPILSSRNHPEEHLSHHIHAPDSGGHAISNPLPIGNSRASSAHHVRLSSIDEPSNSRFRVNEEFSSLNLPQSNITGDVSSTIGKNALTSTASAPSYLERKADVNLLNRSNKDNSTISTSPHSTVKASTTTAPLYSKLHAALTQPRPQVTQSTTPVSQSNINCTRCGRELSSKCLMQTCTPTDETKCRRCGNELTTKCLLAMCGNPPCA